MHTETIPRDLADLPHRMTGSQVCKLAGWSKSTLAARIKSGQIPAPVDRGKGGYLFLRDEVLIALGLAEPARPRTLEPDAAWSFEAGAVNRRLDRDKAQARALARGERSARRTAPLDTR